METIEIHAEEIQPGDVIDHGGHAHLVSRVDHRPGWSWPIAADADGWAIALGHYLVRVLRPTGFRPAA